MQVRLYALAALSCLVSSAYCMPAAVMTTRQPSTEEQPNHQILTVEQLQAAQPLGGLPSNENATLAYSALGIGVQNYTCNGTAYVQTEIGDGAAATLYDTTEFFQRHPNQIDRLAQKCNFKGCDHPCLLDRLLGHHYFSEAIEPTFNLSSAIPPLVLSGVKDDDIPAPNPKSVPWLFLTANTTNGITQGLAEVYRFDTFSGSAPTSCHTVGQTLSLPYTAQYWFYQ